MTQVKDTSINFGTVTVVVNRTTETTTLAAETLTGSANLPKSLLGTMTAETGLRRFLASAITRKMNVTV